jgi:hypothetical protein
MRLGDRAQRVFSSVQPICEWRLGRASSLDSTGLPDSVVPIVELVACLRKIQKSVAFWSQQGGRQGYLNFVSPYLK